MVLNAERVTVNGQHERSIEKAGHRFEKARTNGVRGGIRPCPRCAGALVTGYEEPSCLQCGYVDYHAPPPANGNGKSIFSKGTEFVLRYVGESSWLAGRVANVQLMRVRHKLAYGVSCPFCGGAMQQSSLSGQRREMKEKRFKCEDGHRVSLVPGSSGYMGWR